MRIIVTGGAGFIGSAVVRQLIRQTDARVLNLDALTYAGSLSNIASVSDNPRHHFLKADIRNFDAVARAFAEFQPDGVIHLAAESHVDRSIDGPRAFLETNVTGTCNMLEAARGYYGGLTGAARDGFRFLHVSTDEVFGELGPEGRFTETSSYRPGSPYAATKAAADHLVRAWQRSFGLPCLITSCSNNYGPYQYPEKLIPVLVNNAVAGRSLPIYGTGENVRDWLYVEDHAAALRLVLDRGRVGETYNIGGDSERTNIAIARTVCALLDEMRPDSPACPHERLIRLVTDRPGHDLRYAMDASKITAELGWRPVETFETGLGKTVRWYLENTDWTEAVLNGGEIGRRGLSDRRGMD
ncbi:MAG: dTDP-glucose 4,6-dehydratase [Alphaproteobacteria bacterium]